MFTITDLRVAYDRHVVLDGLSLEVPPGSVSGVIGYNGAGKTTALDAIYGLVSTSQGAFTIDGQTIRREQIAYLPAQNFFYSGITGRDYLELFLRRDRNSDVESWSKLFSLSLDESVESYSTGMKKKLALSGVLMLDKEIVMLDEPFNGLDLESVAILQRILRRLADKGKTVIVTSHIIESLIPVCDRICLLREGRIEKVYASAEYKLLAHSFKEEIGMKYNALIDRVI